MTAGHDQGRPAQEAGERSERRDKGDQGRPAQSTGEGSETWWKGGKGKRSDRRERGQEGLRGVKGPEMVKRSIKFKIGKASMMSGGSGRGGKWERGRESGLEE
jgi:hypothetical protein